MKDGEYFFSESQFVKQFQEESTQAGKKKVYQYKQLAMNELSIVVKGKSAKKEALKEIKLLYEQVKKWQVIEGTLGRNKDEKIYRTKKLTELLERYEQKVKICNSHGFESIRVENSYARRYCYIKEVLEEYFNRIR